MHYPDWQPLQWRASTHALPRLATSTVESLYTCITQTGNLYNGEPLHMHYPDWQPLQWRASTHALPRLATSTMESLYTCITQTGNLYSGEPLHMHYPDIYSGEPLHMHYPDWQPLQWRASTHALPRLVTSTVESLYTCITQTGNLYSGEPLHMHYPDW